MSAPLDVASVAPFPLRAALERAWDDVWNLVHERRQPTIDETAALETRFLDLLDEVERRR